MRKKLTIDRNAVMAALSYDPNTGLFKWRGHRPPRARAKEYAGTLTKYGYLRINVCGGLWMAHILAWLIHYGEIPKSDIDHINRNRADNRIANLRIATRGMNNLNSDRWDHRGPMRGVTPARNAPNRWIAQIGSGGECVYLGRFDTPEEAHKAYLDAAQRRK